MPRYRRKVSEVEAEQYIAGKTFPAGVNLGCLTCADHSGACSFCAKPWVRDGSGRQLLVNDGDWILPEKDGSGFYPLAADKFDELYEPVDPNY